TVGVFTQVLPQIAIPQIGTSSALSSAQLTAKCARMNVAIAVLAAGGLYALAPWVVTLLYGTAFQPAVIPLRVLLIGSLVLAPCNLISAYFTIKLGRPRFVLTVLAASATVSTVICIVLIPPLGILGGSI